MILILAIACFGFAAGFIRYQNGIKETLAKDIETSSGMELDVPSGEIPDDENPDSTEEPTEEEPLISVKAPDLYNMSIEDAKVELDKLNLKYEVVEEKNTSFENGIVFWQEPLMEQEIMQGSTVKVYVSNSALSEDERKINVPVLIGLEKEEATELLHSIGFRVNYEYNPSSDYEEGIVYSQNYFVDAEVSIGTEITIRISTGS